MDPEKVAQARDLALRAAEAQLDIARENMPDEAGKGNQEFLLALTSCRAILRTLRTMLRIYEGSVGESLIAPLASTSIDYKELESMLEILDEEE